MFADFRDLVAAELEPRDSLENCHGWVRAARERRARTADRPNYYDDLQARPRPRPGFVEELRALRGGVRTRREGEFLHCSRVPRAGCSSRWSSGSTATTGTAPPTRLSVSRPSTGARTSSPPPDAARIAHVRGPGPPSTRSRRRDRARARSRPRASYGVRPAARTAFPRAAGGTLAPVPADGNGTRPATWTARGRCGGVAGAGPLWVSRRSGSRRRRTRA